MVRRKKEEIKMINDLHKLVGEKVNFRTNDGCWNCKNSNRWGYDNVGDCKPLTELYQNLLEIKGVSNHKRMEFWVDSENKCDWWTEKD